MWEKNAPHHTVASISASSVMFWYRPLTTYSRTKPDQSDVLFDVDLQLRTPGWRYVILLPYTCLPTCRWIMFSSFGYNGPFASQCVQRRLLLWFSTASSVLPSSALRRPFQCPLIAVISQLTKVSLFGYPFSRGCNELRLFVSAIRCNHTQLSCIVPLFCCHFLPYFNCNDV